MSVGHCHPEVNRAVIEQTRRLQHTTTIYLHNQASPPACRRRPVEGGPAAASTALQQRGRWGGARRAERARQPAACWLQDHWHWLLSRLSTNPISHPLTVMHVIAGGRVCKRADRPHARKPESGLLCQQRQVGAGQGTRVSSCRPALGHRAACCWLAARRSVHDALHCIVHARGLHRVLDLRSLSIPQSPRPPHCIHCTHAARRTTWP